MGSEARVIASALPTGKVKFKNLKLRIMSKQQIYKMVVTITTAIVTCVAIALGLSSCNVTRTITTKSEYWQKADTSVIIQTKTIESYNAEKKGL